MAGFKLSMASWQLAAPGETNRKVRAAAGAGVPVVTGGGPFEVAVEAGRLEDYLALCSSIGVERIEAGQGFTKADLDPADIVKQAGAHHLGVQFELGAKHEGHFDRDQVDALVTLGKRWLDAGAACLVVEARESAQAVGLFDDQGRLNTALADRLAEGLGLESLVFEAPDKRSQFALLDHLGREACLSNIRLEEVLRVEIYRRGLHSDSYDKEGLAFARPRSQG
jgi:phosphosulfolactate synthase